MKEQNCYETISITRYPYTITLLTDYEDDLQRLLQQFQSLVCLPMVCKLKEDGWRQSRFTQFSLTQTHT